MYKSICNQYTVLPLAAGMTVVPLGCSTALNALQGSSDPAIGCLITSYAAILGVAGAMHRENKLADRAKAEGWGATKGTKIIQKAQLKSYFSGLAAGLLTTAFVNAAFLENQRNDLPIQDKQVSLESIPDLSEQITLYHLPE